MDTCDRFEEILKVREHLKGEEWKKKGLLNGEMRRKRVTWVGIARKLRVGYRSNRGRSTNESKIQKEKK